ncbi:DDE-type integrase/transposase/recombinase [Paraburkholderia aspalathi]|nr:DDE-type integrase/transposase/recombinase [Paraburkholderia aspalathi]
MTRPVRGASYSDWSGTLMVQHSTAPVRREKWWRTVDQHDARFDILLQKRRDKVAAERFFKPLLRASDVEEHRKIATDQPHSYPARKAAVPGLANAKHVFVKAAARVG